MGPLIPFWRLRRLGRELGVSGNIVMFGEGARGRIELMVHEVAHAVSLKIPLVYSPKAARVGRAIAVHLGITDDWGRDNEALVLASEFHSLPQLGIDAPPGYDLLEMLIDAGGLQGVSASLITKYINNGAARQLADATIAAITTAIAPDGLARPRPTDRTEARRVQDEP